VPALGGTIHVFVQSLTDPNVRFYKPAVIDSMGGFELELSEILQDGQEYRVLAYAEADAFAPEHGCQADDWLGIWTTGRVNGATEIVLTPTPPASTDRSVDLALCNQLVGDPVPRFRLTITGDGFFAQDQQELLELTVLPQLEDPIPGVEIGHPVRIGLGIGAIEGPGSIRFSDPNALAAQHRERILLYLEADGLEGCSPGDFFGVTVTEPVAAEIELVFSPDTFPQSGDPSADLAICSRFHPGPDTQIGDFATTFQVTGFASLAGKPVKMGVVQGFEQPATQIAKTVVADDGTFTLSIPQAVPTLSVVGNLVLIDADGDGRCASETDTVMFSLAGFAQRDQIFAADPSSPIVNPGWLMPRAQLCDRVFATSP
jgi:hypothetical protein